MKKEDFRKLINKAPKIYAYTAAHGCVEVTRKAALAWLECDTGDVKRCSTQTSPASLWIGSASSGEEITR